MGLLNFLNRRREARLVEQWSAEIADHCHGRVWARVQDRATAMRLSEARGYVRAKAAQVVAEEIAAALGNRTDVGSELRAEIAADAIHSVVSRVFRNLLHLPPSTLHKRHAA